MLLLRYNSLPCRTECCTGCREASRPTSKKKRHLLLAVASGCRHVICPFVTTFFVGRLRSFSRDWQTNYCSSNVLNLITNGYVLSFLSKPNLVRFPLIISEYKALPRTKPWPLYPVSTVQERYRKGGKCKISQVLQSPVSST